MIKTSFFVRPKKTNSEKACVQLVNKNCIACSKQLNALEYFFDSNYCPPCKTKINAANK